PRGRPIEFTGVAFDKGDGIKQVEYSVDDGETWRKAELEKSYGKYAWRVWHAKIEFDQSGEQEVLCRATSNSGEQQPLEVSEDIMDNGGRKETAARAFASHITVEDG